MPKPSPAENQSRQGEPQEMQQAGEGLERSHRPVQHLAMGPHPGMGHPKQSQQRGHTARHRKHHTRRRQAAGTPLCRVFSSQKWVTPRKDPQASLLLHHRWEGSSPVLCSSSSFPTTPAAFAQQDTAVSEKALGRKPARCQHLGASALAGRSLSQTQHHRGVAQPKPFHTARKRHPMKDAFAPLS